LLGGLLADRTAVGATRKAVVHFDDSRYTPPDTPDLVREAFDLFCEKAAAITNPHEQAFFTMAFIPYLQPFLDGNKRTSRIAMNVPLIKHQLAPFAFADISRRDYTFGLLALYERSTHSFLADAFTTAYAKSAARYTDLIQHVNDGGLLGTLTVDSEETKGEELPGMTI